MRRVVTVSYTGLDAPGGVPRWNRDLHSAFPERERVHYSWDDYTMSFTKANIVAQEWERARTLGRWLLQTGRVRDDDIVLVDGFWGNGLERHPCVISVSHGNWSHTTLDDVRAGVPPEFPFHHREQLRYRKEHVRRGGRLVAVSKFIADQCRMQWGLEMPFINNGIDTTAFHPLEHDRVERDRPLIIHGTTTANKGFDHIEGLREGLPEWDVLLLDEASDRFGVPKYDALANADLVVHPSAHEGNSYFVLETLASGVPLVSYNVGLMWELWEGGFERRFGRILDRRERSPSRTLQAVTDILSEDSFTLLGSRAREMAQAHSIEMFRSQWRAYVEEVERA